MPNTILKSSYIKVMDHSVSGENFELLYNEQLDMLETHPKPSGDTLPNYYKSEDYISHTDAKRNVFEHIYHLVKRIALKRKLDLINEVSGNGRSLLDVGCGTGDFLKFANQSGWIISGIEPNPDARAMANKKTNGSVYNTDQLSKFEACSFDVITLWHVLEHLPELEEQLSFFKKLLKPDGALIIAVPNYKSYDAKRYKSFWAAYDAPRHLWHFSQTSIKTLGAALHMEVHKTVPMKFDAFYVSLLSEKYKSGKMNFIKGFWHGWCSNWQARRSGEYSSLIYVLKNR